jgi:hypothetical protein
MNDGLDAILIDAPAALPNEISTGRADGDGFGDHLTAGLAQFHGRLSISGRHAAHRRRMPWQALNRGHKTDTDEFW